MTTLTDTEALALSKAVATKIAKAARKNVNPGEHPVDFMVRVAGTLKVGEDGTKRPTASILNAEFLALCLHHAGVTRESIKGVIEAVAADYLKGWDGSDDVKADAKAQREALLEELGIENFVADIKGQVAESLPPVPSKGIVRATLEVQRVQTIDVSQDASDDEAASDEAVA